MPEAVPRLEVQHRQPQELDEELKLPHQRSRLLFVPPQTEFRFLSVKNLIMCSLSTTHEEIKFRTEEEE
ncbi:MAG: hypothetical protein EBU33_06270 [Sphingobacteriia bacterium]|nr:hypothetical protein [Sphingobacteriia bacterium]